MDLRPMRPLLFAACLLPVPAAADEVTDQIQSALEAYEQQDLQGAISDLNYAVAQIQEMVNTQNAQLLPEPLEGWTASEVENAGAAMSMLGGGTNMTRRYQHDGESVEINIVANSPWVMSMMQMMGNPMLMASNPNLKPYRYKRLKGMKDTSDGRTEVTLSVVGQIMVKVTGQNLADEAVIEQYLDAIDFEKIQTALLQ
jgi:hypothetical protein